MPWITYHRELTSTFSLIVLAFPVLSKVDSPRKLAPAKGPSMADGIVRETIKYPKSATRLHAPSMDSGSHGETGKSVPPPAEVERRR